MPESNAPCESLAEMLRISTRNDLEYEVRLHDFWGQALGAQALAATALAAIASCPGRELRSLHASFVTAPPCSRPLALHTTLLADDRFVSRRQVDLVGEDRHCRAIATLTPREEGLGYQDHALDPSLPDPESLPSTAETAAQEGWSDYAMGPLECRRVGPLLSDPARGSAAREQWVKSRAPLSASIETNAAVVVFLCDFYSHWAFECRVGAKFAHDRFWLLDQSIVLHHAPAFRDWWFMRSTSEVSSGGFALGRRDLYTADGLLVASAQQTARVSKS